MTRLSLAATILLLSACAPHAVKSGGADMASSHLPGDGGAPGDLSPPAGDLSAPPDLAPGDDLSMIHFASCNAQPQPACTFAATTVAMARPGAPTQVLTAFVDGDKKADVIVQGGTFVSVLLGNGDGTFKAQIDTYVGEGGNVGAGDFNKDGKLDFVVAAAQKLTTWLGKGDGTFTAGATQTTASLRYNNVFVADFDEDGKLDVVLAHEYLDGPGQLLLGNGDGTFKKAVAINGLGGPNDWYVVDCAAADVDGDGHMDLVASDFNYTAGTSASALTVLFGDGKGAFSPVTYDWNAPGALVVRDVNKDGKADVLEQYQGTLYVSLSQGRTFEPAISTQTGLQFTDGALATDFDGDGKMDLVTSANYAVHVMLGDGAGNFAAPVQHAVARGGANDLDAADFDGDGAADVVSFDWTTLAVSSKGGDSAVPEATFSGVGVASVVFGDLDGDLRPDVVAVGGTTLTSLLRQADGSYKRVRPDTHTNGQLPGAIAADFDHDHHLDVLVGGQLMLGNGDGTFHEGAATPMASPLAAADFNEDGWLDVLYQSSTKVQISLSDGSGSFKSLGTVDSGALPPEGAVIADVDHDGHLDFVVSFPALRGPTAYFTVHLGRGDGTFKTAIFGDPMQAGTPLAGDFNCDGNVDVSVKAFPFLGVGDGRFVGQAAWSVAAAGLGDFNHDGILDIAGQSDSGSVVTLLGNGDGTMQAAISLGALPYGGGSVSTTDVDGDGRPDVVVTQAGAIQVVRNSCTR